jgi:hypothetical protein
VVRVHKGVATLEQDGIEGTASQEWRDYPRLSIDVRHVQQWQYALNRARAQRQ